MESIEDVSAFVRSLDASIDNLSEALDPVFSQKLEDLISNCLLPQEKVKIYHSHLYTVISILFAYIKVLGIKTETHPIMKELNRIKASMKAFKEIEISANKRDDESKKSAEAANQFLQRTLGTAVGNAAPDHLKSPAISSANFKGTHTKFTDEDNLQNESHHTRTKTQSKVTKPKHRKN
ncbi:hypothetical protein METBIDRAFT_45105 [Metschnikowia bicuspidata var. bicuspidata NRRL YB-4993]|uniref:Exosome complex protein n=1 Tax=Metschnikowia bicuspidata var. bicuspidata NRRL YB-4993 TaxID=869754 RepID=A0A1A0H887_9ASCO|nr:hypothetical protein METBIDRAFT_45105 [Metschnikowia bicuspidata var. bicuspidata NRRL YB-4993]OBA20108.1 hypothetical protein METBIDRAFT_45105 [Metschnikowia bicuspidata var. bicuspidata NRRL YB-4993]